MRTGEAAKNGGQAVGHLNITSMLWSFPPTRKQLAVTAGWFLSGVALFAAGAHLSYVNVAPQQARTKARDDFVRDYLRKKYGYEGGHKQQR